VELDEWSSRTRPAVVECAGEQLFAGAGLTRDQYGGVAVGPDARRALEHRLEGGALAHDVAERMRLRLELRQRRAAEGGAAALHGRGEGVAQPVAVVGEREIVGRPRGHDLRRQPVRRRRADRDDGYASGNRQLGEQRCHVGFVPGRGHDHDTDSRGRRPGLGRRPLREQHAEIARQGGPEVTERVAQPDDEQRDVAGRGHRTPRSMAVTRTSTAWPACSSAARPPSSRSTTARTPSTRPPAAPTAAIASAAEWPVVITSSTTTTAAPGVKIGRRRDGWYQDTGSDTREVAYESTAGRPGDPPAGAPRPSPPWRRRPPSPPRAPPSRHRQPPPP